MIRLRKLALVLPALLIASVPAQATISRVQQNDAETVGSTTNSVTFTRAQAAGNLIVVALKFSDNATFVSLTDTSGNTYVQCGDEIDYTTEQVRARIYAAYNIASAAANSNTVTLTVSTVPNDDIRLWINEYSGAAVSGANDVNAATFGAASGTANDNITSGTATTSVANELLFGFLRPFSGPGIAGTGFTSISTSGGNLIEEQLSDSAGTNQATATDHVSGDLYIMMMATFTPASTGAVPNITSLSPTSGAIGSSVTITGTNFGTTPGTVRFNGTAVTQATWSPTSITVQVPAGATTGNVLVTVGGLASNGVKFTILTPINRVQQNDAETVGSTTNSVTFTGAQTAGNLIVVALKFSDNAAFVSLSDTAGNTYVQCGNEIDGTNQHVRARIYAAYNIFSAAANRNTVTVTVSAVPNDDIRLWINEYSGAATAAANDANVGTPGTSWGAGTDNLTSGSAATSVANELIFGFGVPLTGPLTAGTGFTSISTSGGNIVEEALTNAAGSNQVTATEGFNNDPSIMMMATFVPQSSGSAPTITSLSPTSGAGGTSVTITGTNFGSTQGTSTVIFNGTAATPCPTCGSPTSITVPLPVGATSGNVHVAVDGVASNGVNFTVVTPILRVQANDGEAVGSTTESVTFPNAQTAGNLIVVALKFSDNAAFVSLSDTAGNTYVLCGNEIDDTNQHVRARIYAAYNIASAAANANTVTVTVSAVPNDDIRLWINEYSGAATVAANDANAGTFSISSGSGTDNLTSDNAATSVANELVFGLGVPFQGPSIAGTGFTSISTSGGNIAEEILTSNPGSNQATATDHATDERYIMMMATFLPTSGHSSPTVTSLSPTSGPAGTSVTVTGANFGSSEGTSTVTFNGTLVAPTNWSSTSITVPVPIGATSGPVVVTVSGLASNGVNFTVVVNQPPVVTVGPDQTITYPTATANLTGTVTDDGYPIGYTLQISWSKVVGSGNVSFNPSQCNAQGQCNTQATFSAPGNYVLRLSADDGQYTTSADTRVIYLAPTGGSITVNAGPNQVLVFPASAILSGSASDSNAALASALTTAWTVVSGPGTVSFANSASPATSATFSAPGVYDLRLTASDGIFTASSDVRIYLGQVQCTQSSKGTDFWLMFIDASGNANDLPQQQLELFISSDVATSGIVSVPGLSLSIPFNTTPGQVTPINLTTPSVPVQAIEVTTTDTVETKGIHITAQNPIAVYGLNFLPASTDGYLGLPTNVLGTSYVIASYRNTEVGASFAGFGTEFGIIATQNNTHVTIVPTATSTPNTGISRVAQQPFTIQLNQGQTYQLQNSTNYTEVSSSSKLPVDYTGTIVTSDKPIAVFGGHVSSFVPDQFLYSNHLVEELPPTNLWGQNFVTMPLAQEANGDTYRVIAQASGTQVQVNHQQVAVLQAGQFYEQVIHGPAEISANQPILVVEYADSDAFSGLSGSTNLADPSMIIVPPFEQFGGSYTITTPNISFPANFINVIAPTSAAQGATVLLDGSPILPASFQPIGTSPFSGAQISVSMGAHTLSAGLPLGVTAYGFNVQDAYGYTGGACFAKGVPGATITPSPTAGTDQLTTQACIQATVTDSSGNPIGGAGVTFSVTGVNSQSGFATTNANGVATFCYTSVRTGSDLITIASGGASTTASVTWVSTVNQPPVVSAGPVLNLYLPSSGPVTATLHGTVVDDGLPVGGTLTSTWSEVTGPASVSFGTPSQAQTTATFSQAGSYQLELTANDSQLSSSATVTVTVNPPNQPPSISNAGPNQSFIWFQGAPLSVPLSGTVTDDGLPTGSTLTANWNEASGPASVSFGTATFSGHSPISAATSVTVSEPGTYLLQLSANDTQFITTSGVTVSAFGPVNVNFGPSLQTSTNTAITLAPTVLLGGQPPNGSMPLHLQWVVDGQPSGSHVTLGSPNAASTTASFDTPGSYQLGLTTADANLPANSVGNCCVTVTVAVTGAQAPTVSIANPVDGTQITAPTTVSGSVSGGTWTLAYALQNGSSSLTFTTIATGTGAVSNGTLGTLDPTVLLNGTYVLQLTSVDTTSGLFASASVTVSAARNMKVGVFSFSFNDLTIPVSGIPIQVIRSYDSRDKTQGDFGVGWRLSLANIRVQKAHDLSINWQETATQNSFLPQFCLAPTDNKIVTVTFPDGRVFTFQAGSNPQCQIASPITNAALTFTELPGPSNTAGASLTPANGGQLLIDGNAPGPVTTVGLDGNPYNPTAFVLQTADGTKYTIDAQLGLTAVTDTNGNTLTITANGILSSTGKSVPFGRDQQGRITTITDLNENTLLYQYDSNGDLGSFTDRSKNTTTYTYVVQNGVSSHNLLQAILPNGTNALTNAFDTSGRLTGTTDANGLSVSFSNNVPGQTQTVTDRNGNATTYVYDSDGNVTQVTDALGHVTTSTYDGNDNKLSETNALGKTSTYTYDSNGNQLTQTDPLNHTTTYTYNALNKPLTITDANGHTTTNTYDGNGNLLTTTDALGKRTTNTYSSSGLLASTQDPLGNTTSFTYDGSGNLLTQTDALGTVTTYTYDSNGNRTSQSVTRTLPGGTQQTLVTSYTYDGNGRLTKTTYPDSSTTQTIYNTIGQQATTIDALNRQTSYQYDADGNLAQTTYPDTSVESSIYDHNGNRTRFTARTGVVTSYVYDSLNRLAQTQDNSARTLSSTTYDAIGEALTSTDADANVTQYAYDAAGRRTTVTDALTHVTTFGYDSAGNQTSVQDANNHVTTYSYDNDNRRTQVTYPDGKFETTTYDPVGRVTARTDANGKTTQYGYDAIGRLTGVTDALSQVTSYSYDQVGNRLTQTDANTHTTNYNYDQRGRRTQRTLPLGQSESYTYDIAGNLLTHADFNGKTTTYTYDPANRILSKTPDPSFSAPAVTYTYTATGLRNTMTDASGTTSYSQYDNRGRLTNLSKPAGGLQYTYDLAGNLTRISGQTNVNYTYDALNRLSTVSEVNTGTTTYAYDNVGNLQSVTYPNGVVHNYTYDTRNRITNLGVNGTVSGAPGAIASYAYTLDAAGHRLSVSELSGRTVNYGYDNLYRLTSETIASDPHAINGAVNYTYDAVGNRKQIASTLAPVPAGLWNYDANDRFTAGDTYDADGNTVSSGGIANVYDFENHLIQKGGATIVYDGDGNRVKKVVAGITTTYLVDTLNPTGYAQVLAESFSGASGARELSHNYVYGLELISQARNYFTGTQTLTQTIYYVYDGHGSVRALTDPSGTVTDTYDYDAFGNLLHSTGTTPNNYLFAGEQFDPDLHLYYNRARYLNTNTGRFWSMDTFEGRSQEPLSLHKYLYVAADPVNHVDRSGKDLAESIAAVSISVTLFVSSVPQLLTEAFEEGGTAVGVLFNEFGQVAENYAGQVLALVEDAIPEIEALPQQPVGQRVIDFVVRNTETAKQLFIEVKYGLPSSAEALSRLVAQVQAASQAAQQGGGQVLLWTLKNLTPQELQTLESEIGNTNVQIVSGVENLYKVVTNYFQ